MPIDNDKIMEKLTELHGEFREFRGAMTVRVKNIEEDAKDARKWENYKIYMVLPVTAALHELARHLGLTKG